MKKGEKFLTHKEACEYLDISSATMNRWLAKKILPGYKVVGKWRFYISELDDWIEESSNDQRRKS